MLDWSFDSEKKGGVAKENWAPVSDKESCRFKKGKSTPLPPSQSALTGFRPYMQVPEVSIVLCKFLLQTE